MITKKKRLINTLTFLFHRIFPINSTTKLSFSARLSRDISIGSYSYIGPNCEIGSLVSIGNYFMAGSGVKVVGNDHIYDTVGTPTIFSGRPSQTETKIGDDVWVGTNAIIFRGLEIGDHTIIAAGAVVTKNVPENSIVAGVPARIIGNRFSDEDLILHKREYSVNKGRKFANRIVD